MNQSKIVKLDDNLASQVAIALESGANVAPRGLDAFELREVFGAGPVVSGAMPG
jgi:hypothetical protein